MEVILFIGSFTIMAMFIGYETIEKEIQVAADQEYKVNLTLKASAIELQETKVTAEKRKEICLFDSSLKIELV
jgi:hypothetical protein